MFLGSDLLSGSLYSLHLPNVLLQEPVDALLQFARQFQLWLDRS